MSSTADAIVINIADNRLVRIADEASIPAALLTSTYADEETPSAAFVAFDEMLTDSVDRSVFLGFGFARTEGAASQTSTVDAMSFVANGSVALDFEFDAAGVSHGTSESTFDIRFSTDRSYSYELSGDLASSSSRLSAQALVRLASESGTIQEFSGGGPFDVSGVLAAGTYTLPGVALAEEPA